MTSNWKDVLDANVVKNIPENAKYTNGVPNIAAITRAGIAAGLDNVQIQNEVAKLHKGGTPINCIRWYRNNPGPRRTTARAGFREAYALFKEQGKEISKDDLAAIAEANLAIIFGARGADLSVLSTYGIMDNFKAAMEEKKQKMIAEKIAKMEAAKAAKKAAAEEKAAEKAEVKKEDKPATPATKKKLVKKK